MGRKVRTTLALLFSTLALTGCVTPSQNYATSKETGTYFTAPASWSKISQKELTKVERASTSESAQEKLSLTRWEEAYALSETTTAADVLSAKAPTEPIAYARVRYLNGTEINTASYNFLRDLVFPITSWVEGSITAPSDLTILDDAEVTQKAAQGVRTEISFTGKDGVLQTFDQTALLSTDRRTIYVLIVRCSSTCFEKHQTALSSIIQSFTVRGDA